MEISFKYLGSFVSSHELLSFLEDCLITNAGKAGGAVRSACRSAVALPISRLVCLHKSLVSPIALLNCVAWFPFLEQNGKWYAAQQAQWWFFLGFKARPSKEYLISCWLNFEPWEVSGALQVLNFISQMTRAPPGSFLAAILVELKSECMRSPKAWLFCALRVPFSPVSLGQGEVVSSLSPLSEAGLLLCFVPVLSFLVASHS